MKGPAIKLKQNLSPASQVIRRGQDSNLQPSDHEPDEVTNSSTPSIPSPSPPSSSSVLRL